MPMQLDYYGFVYNPDDGPSFVRIGSGMVYHKPSRKYLKGSALEAQMEEAGYTPADGEYGEDEAWAEQHLGVTPSDPAGGGGGDVDVPLAILSPADGSTVSEANYPITGEGAEAGAEVSLWGTNGDPSVDPALETVTAGPDGTFTFDGSTDAPEGATTWKVKSGDETATATVTYTPDAGGGV